jgi:hypothetical protein
MAKPLMVTVLLTDAEEWPRHEVTMEYRTADWPKWRGKPIQIVNKPIRRPSSWNCDSEFIWPVAHEITRAINPNADCTHFVCRHQIQIGD